MNGYAVCKNLKSSPNTMSIPIVMVTALKEKEDRIKAIEAGADDFLSRPVDMYELNARMKFRRCISVLSNTRKVI